jgi:SM-20-related protein
MEKDFEAMISGYISENVGVADHFLSDELAAHLKKNILSLQKKKLLVPAGTGKNNEVLHDSKVRGDTIYWLDRSHEDKYENEFLDQIDDFVKYLNRSCFAGITNYEFHYSLYDTGAFYKKHLDQFINNPQRKFSMVSYLNENWKESDGGQLKIYQSYNDKKITPVSGKSVFFKSDELQHEVMVTNEPRMSIAGWLKTS